MESASHLVDAQEEIQERDPREGLQEYGEDLYVRVETLQLMCGYHYSACSPGRCLDSQGIIAR